ncbi:MAG: hypothetical protein JXR51_16700 [Bacteroidales bacterium]|nr:hypothetical protein [Bacteroidales bacterium]MBN2758808.1 hypothetical protein [Bacteroidales bacterium]
MKTMKLKSIFLLTAILIFALTSCEKSSFESNNEAILTTEEASSADGLFDDADDQSEIYDDNEYKSTEDLSYCQPTITIEYPEGTPYPRIVTIDFGNDGCEGRNGRVRKGIIIYTLTNDFSELGSQRIISFDNYYVNDFKIEGSKTITNTGINEIGNLTRKIEVNGQITTPEGNVIIRNAIRYKELIEGFGTPEDHWDDVFSITGTASGINSNGNSYESEIIEPLIKARNCKWVQTGILSIISDENTITIDFGQGTCDNVATATINGEEKEIKFRW